MFLVLSYLGSRSFMDAAGNASVIVDIETLEDDQSVKMEYTRILCRSHGSAS